MRHPLFKVLGTQSQLISCIQNIFIPEALGLSGPLQSDGPTGRCAIAPVIKRTIIELLQVRIIFLTTTKNNQGQRSPPLKNPVCK